MLTGSRHVTRQPAAVSIIKGAGPPNKLDDLNPAETLNLQLCAEIMLNVSEKRCCCCVTAEVRLSLLARRPDSDRSADWNVDQLHLFQQHFSPELAGLAGLLDTDEAFQVA